MARRSPLARPIVGEPAPDITLVTADGDPWRLADRRGRTVVLVFHRHIH
jgi:peroxiredoxin